MTTTLRFRDGAKAFLRGVSIRRNPHKPGSIAGRQWREGWREESLKAAPFDIGAPDMFPGLRADEMAVQLTPDLPPEPALVLDRQPVIDAFRESVLAMLDHSAAHFFAKSPMIGRDPGASDIDLPDLFKAIDAHVDRLAVRFGYAWSE